MTNSELPSLYVVPVSLIVKAKSSAEAEAIAKRAIHSRSVYEIGTVPGERIDAGAVARVLERRRKRTREHRT